MRLFLARNGGTAFWGRLMLVVLLASISLTACGSNLTPTIQSVSQVTPTSPIQAAATGSKTGAKANIRDFQLLVGEQGWVLSEQKLWWTTTNGAAWLDITPSGVKKGSLLTKVYFLDAKSGWVVMTRPTSLGVQLAVAFTDDSGKNWQEVVLPNTGNLQYPENYSNIAGLNFVDAKHGWLMVKLSSGNNFSLGELFKTEDGGRSWAALPPPPIAEAVRFTSPTQGWLAGGPAGDKLYATQDGGASWQAQNVSKADPETNLFYDLPTFLNSQEGLLPVTMVGLKTTTVVFYATQDGGVSWQPQNKIENLTDTTKVPTAVINQSSQVVGRASNGQSGFTISQTSGKQPSRTTLTPAALTDQTAISQLQFNASDKGWLGLASGSCVAKTKCSQQIRLFSTVNGSKELLDITP